MLRFRGHAVPGMTECAAQAYAARNIRINAACPAAIMMSMVENMMRAGAIARVIAAMGTCRNS